jgi:hypothetical protein
MHNAKSDLSFSTSTREVDGNWNTGVTLFVLTSAPKSFLYKCTESSDDALVTSGLQRSAHFPLLFAAIQLQSYLKTVFLLLD